MSCRLPCERSFTGQPASAGHSSPCTCTSGTRTCSAASSASACTSGISHFAACSSSALLPTTNPLSSSNPQHPLGSPGTTPRSLFPTASSPFQPSLSSNRSSWTQLLPSPCASYGSCLCPLASTHTYPFASTSFHPLAGCSNFAPRPRPRSVPSRPDARGTPAAVLPTVSAQPWTAISSATQSACRADHALCVKPSNALRRCCSSANDSRLSPA